MLMANMLFPIFSWRIPLVGRFHRPTTDNHGPADSTRLRTIPLVALAATLASGSVGYQLFGAEQPKVDFARDIQPIFIKRCYECHGPDKQKNDLRLDRKADALRGGKSGKPLFLAGKSAESELIARVTSQDPDEVMPAKGERLRA